MLNVKRLEERKNYILEKMEEMKNTISAEKRDLNDVEKREFDELKESVEVINDMINHIDEQGDEVREGDVEMKKEVEIRALNQFIKRRTDAEEIRTLNITPDNKAVIPENVANEIVRILQEESPVYERARKIYSVTGNLKIAKENSTSIGGFVGEGKPIALGKFDLGAVNLSQKRVGAGLELSQQLINDSAVDLVGYATELLAQRTARAIEKAILTGEGGDEDFAGIIADEEVQKVEADAVNMDVFMDMYNSLHPSLLGSAMWIMSRTMFNQVAKLKDANGHYFLQNGIVNGKPTYTLFGSQVVVTSALEELDTPVVFGSVAEGYTILQKKELNLQQVSQDSDAVLHGKHLLVLDGYMDGAVHNPQAFVVLEATGEIEG